jgi:hypothetical protein
MSEAPASSNSNGVARPVAVAHRDDQLEGSADAGLVTGQPVADSQSPPPSTTAPSSTSRSPKKRRKVNHGEDPALILLLFHWPASASSSLSTTLRGACRLTRRRVTACVYCRRSHMTCNDGMSGLSLERTTVSFLERTTVSFSRVRTDESDRT